MPGLKSPDLVLKDRYAEPDLGHWRPILSAPQAADLSDMVKCVAKALNPVDSHCEGTLARQPGGSPGLFRRLRGLERVFTPSTVGASSQHDRALTGNLAVTCEDA